MRADRDPETRKPEKIAGGFRSTDGPVFSRRGYLLFSDLPDRMMKWERGAIVVFRGNSGGAKGLTFDHQGRLLACEAARVTRTEKDGSIAVLAEAEGAPKDLVYAIDGSIYFTDPPAGCVVQITRHGPARVVSREARAPTGVALAPDQQSLYVADGPGTKIRRHSLAPDGGLREGSVFAALPWPPEGLKTDEAGAVWVAGSGGVWTFDRAGRHTGAVALPERPCNLNWGEGFRNLYVTAGTSVYRLGTESSGTRTY